MSVLNFVGNLDVKINIPGEVHVNGAIVGDNISLAYSGDRLKLTFVPILHDGTRLSPVTSVSQITYQKGKLGLIGIEIGSQTSYMVNYAIFSKRLTITVNGKANTTSVRSIAEAINAIIGVITTNYHSGMQN